MTFHDGTPFNAQAVCANFNRWYNFKGALQNPAASYYYGVVFAGFQSRDWLAGPEERPLPELPRREPVRSGRQAEDAVRRRSSAR